MKIVDFGISKSAMGTDLSLTQTSSVLGTPAYMSPEQMRSARSVDAHGHLVARHRALRARRGRRPFRAETFSEMCVVAAVDPYDAMQRAPELEPVIARCLAKAPEDRFATIAELAAALGAAATTGLIAWRMQRTKPAAAMEEGERIEMHAIIDVDAAAPVPAITPDAAVAIDPAAPTPDAGSAKRAVRRGGTKRTGIGSASGSGSGSATKKCNVWESRAGCT